MMYELKKMSKKLFLAVLVMYIAAAMILTAVPITVNAEGSADAVNSTNSNANAAVITAEDSVVRVNVSLVLKNGKTYFVQCGSGFYIGDEANSQYIVTNYHVTHIDDDTLKEAAKFYGFSAKKVDKVKIEIIISGDVSLEVTESKNCKSQLADYAVLEASEAFGTPLRLADSNEVKQTQEVWALGFPTAVSYDNQNKAYTAEKVMAANGTIQNVNFVNGDVPYFLHGAALTGGNSGGPLVNSNGEVIGINTFTVGDKYNSSLKINELRDILDKLGIPYLTADSTVTDAEPSTEPSTDDTESESESEPSTGETASAAPSTEDAGKTRLQDLVDRYEKESISTDEYTADSVQSYTAALTAAQSLLDVGGSSNEYVDSYDKLSGAKDALEQKSNNTTLYIIIGVAAGVIILVIIIILVVVNGNKKKKNQQRRPNGAGANGQGSNGTGANSSGSNVQHPSGAGQGGQAYGGAGNGNTYTQSMQGAGETGVLNDGAGETTLLSGANQMGAAALVRIKNGEQTKITKSVFKIGKERMRVDYCISDNPSISRNHAQIICKNGAFYLANSNPTNGTFVNGVKLDANQEIALNSNDRIKFADEEFQFRVL